MASFVYNEFKRAIAAGEIDLDADTISVRLVMSTTTVDTENDGVATLSDFGNIVKCDGANYVDKILADKTVTKVDGSDLAKFDATDVTWTALGVGGATTQGALLYKAIGSDSEDIPIAFIEFASAVTHDGSDFTIQWSTSGILTLT